MAENTDPAKVSFVCQRCLQPLRIDPSFYSMSEHTTAELSLNFLPTPEIDLEASETKLDHFVPAFKLQDPNSSKLNFTLVGESGQNVSLGSKLKKTAELFDIISNNGDIDHPLCEECTDTLLESMDQQLKLAEDEAQEYQAYLQKLENETEDESRVKELEEELDKLLGEEKSLRDELDTLKKSEREASDQLRSLKSDKAKLEQEEQKYWKEYSKHKRELLIAEDDFRSLDCQQKYAQAQIERLKKTNAFNATFHIWHTGHFATINGFRLGRLLHIPVEWAEINAAWGQTALLLWALARKLGISFNKYQVVPYGSYSYIKNLADEKTLPLYGSGGIRMIFDSKFDSAMVAFLDCLNQFANEVQRHGAFSLPYEMDKGKIRDSNSGQWYSIKLQFNSEDMWTKALRYMLTNLKWGLAFVSMQYNSKQEPVQGQADKAETPLS
jgi:beclin 1